MFSRDYQQGSLQCYLLSYPVVGIDVERLNNMTKSGSIFIYAEFNICTAVPEMTPFIIFTIVS